VEMNIKHDTPLETNNVLLWFMNVQN